MQFWSSSDSCFSSKNLNVDQNCIFEENKSGDHQISERRSVDQNCIGTHLPSRERGGRGPKIIPQCIIQSCLNDQMNMVSQVHFLKIFTL